MSRDTQAMEANFDGLIGPTHNYGGLSDGNLASAKNAGLIARPKAAALQGLDKMEALHNAGIWQGVLPPQQRPHLPTLRRLGYRGSNIDIYSSVWEKDPRLAKNMMSASSMWSANAATVSPSADTQDARPHRSVFADEGAANHVRLCAERGQAGVELFVYGRDGYAGTQGKFPARQTLQASQTIARNHRLHTAQTVFARQSQTAIDHGAFHNDVVCVGALDCLFYHELAFADTAKLQLDIRTAAQGKFSPQFIEVSSADVPLKDAISAYLFNSMLKTKAYCSKLISGNGPIGSVHYVDVRQSMKNGGGPACLRLRITLTPDEWAQVNPKMKIDTASLTRLRSWVNKHYREDLAPKDLKDPALMLESFTALDALSAILDLGSDFYPFQRN